MENKPPFISVVSPVYLAEGMVDELVERTIAALIQITPNYEIILVEDGSPDDSWGKICEKTSQYTEVKGVKLSRNFGQHYAISAGLNKVKGDWIVVMDCDLQDQPEEISKLLTEAQTASKDIVFALRKKRHDNFLKKKLSCLFYNILGYLTDTEQNAEIANFGIYRRKVIDAILSMKDSVKYFPTMVKWVGFSSSAIPVDHAPRLEGESAYDFWKLQKLAIGIILSFSDNPLKLIVRFGLWLSFGSFIGAIYNFYRAIVGDFSVLGYGSLIVSIWFLSGILITLLGMIGLYIGRIFDQVKDRPVFIIDQEVNI